MMHSKLFLAVLLVASFLPMAKADTPSAASVRISCVCVGKHFTDGSGCTYVELEESGINILTGETVWTRSPASWGNCNTQSANDFATCQDNLRHEPLCRVD